MYLRCATLVSCILATRCVRLQDADEGNELGDEKAVSSEEMARAQTQARSAMAVQMMDSVSSYLQSTAAEKEVADLRQEDFVAILENEGISLDQQLRWFALSKVLDRDGHDQQVEQLRREEHKAMVDSLIDLANFVTAGTSEEDERLEKEKNEALQKIQEQKAQCKTDAGFAGGRSLARGRYCLTENSHFYRWSGKCFCDDGYCFNDDKKCLKSDHSQAADGRPTLKREEVCPNVLTYKCRHWKIKTEETAAEDACRGAGGFCDHDDDGPTGECRCLDHVPCAMSDECVTKVAYDAAKFWSDEASQNSSRIDQVRELDKAFQKELREKVNDVKQKTVEELQDLEEDNDDFDRFAGGEDAEWYDRIKGGLETLREAVAGSSFESSLSTTDPVKYRAWKKDQAHRTGRWAKGLMDKVSKKARDGYDSMRDTAPEVARAKQILEEVVEINSQLAEMDAKFKMASKADWVHYEVKDWGDKFKEAFGNLVRGIVHAFKAFANTFQKQCHDANNKAQDEALKSAKVKSVDEMAEALGSGSNATVVTEDFSKVDAALGQIESTGDETAAKLDEISTKLKSADQKAKDGDLSEKDAGEARAAVEELPQVTCTSWGQRRARQLKNLWHQVLEVIRHPHSANLPKLPNMGARGIGGFASALAGGIEEVVDFRNREIGYFTWGAVAVGGSLGSIGISGYTGFAWKGYKEDWNLEEAVQTATTVAYSLSLPLPLSAGMGVCFAIDADNSMAPWPHQGAWALDPGGVDGVVFSLGFSVGVSLPLSFDVGQSLYGMLTSECFDNTKDFLKAILMPTCSTCPMDSSEKTQITAARMLTHAASWPILTELIFMGLAWANDLRYGPNIERGCSSKSTKHRDDLNHLSELVVTRLDQTTQFMEELFKSSEIVQENMENAIAVNPDILHVKKFKSATLALSRNVCLKRPAVLSDVFVSEDNPFGKCDAANLCSRDDNMECGEAEAAEMTFVFEPGEPGIDVNSDSPSIRVFKGEQADRLGLRPGMRILTIDGELWTKQGLKDAVAGTENYEVTFAQESGFKVKHCKCDAHACYTKRLQDVGILSVKVVGAKDLPQMDVKFVDGYTDARIAISVGASHKETEVVQDNLNPEFNNSKVYSFVVQQDQTWVDLTVWDEDIFGVKEHIATASYNFGKTLLVDAEFHEVELFATGGQCRKHDKRCQITVQMEFAPIRDAAAAQSGDEFECRHQGSSIGLLRETIHHMQRGIHAWVRLKQMKLGKLAKELHETIGDDPSKSGPQNSTRDITQETNVTVSEAVDPSKADLHDLKRESGQLQPELRLGTSVRIHGLKRATDLNGLEGSCAEFLPDSGRWRVQLQNGEFKDVKPANLQFVANTHQATASSSSVSAGYNAAAASAPDASTQAVAKA